VVAAANGTATAVVVWAVSSRSSSAGDASPASNSVNPYGLAFAPAVTGASKPQGEKSVSWTWTQPNGNGRPVTGYQYSLDGGSWVNTDQRSFSTGAAYSETKTLRVRAISAGQPGRIGSDTSRSGSEPPPPVPTSQVQVEATTIRTCPGKPNQTDTYSEGPPKTCGAGWVERSEGRLTINCTKDIYGNGTPWFRVTEGSHPGWFVKSTTVDLYGPRPGGC